MRVTLARRALAVLLVAGAVLGCPGGGSASSSGASGGGKCDVSTLTCGQILPSATLMARFPTATSYVESGHLPCRFTLPKASGGIFQAFCGDAALLSAQLETAKKAYPGMATENDAVGKKSFDLVVGAPSALGSIAEVNAVTQNGKYVFNVSLSSSVATLDAARALAKSIDQNLSAL